MAGGMKPSLLRYGKLALPFLVLMVFLALPKVRDDQDLIRILFATFVWTITGIAWNIIGGFAGQVSFGFAVFYGLGAYTAALLINAGRNPYFAFLGAAGIAMLASFLVGLPTFRLRGPYFAIATIGITEAVRVVMRNLQLTGGASGVRITELREFRPLEHYYAALAAAALAVLLSLLIERGRF